MRASRTVPTSRVGIVLCLAGILAVLVGGGTAAAAPTPKPGTYRAVTTQCGSTAQPHACYGFTIKIAKGHCVAAPSGHQKRAGYCATFSHSSHGSTAFTDVTCPDGVTFQSDFIGPQIPYLIPSSGSLHFFAHGSTSEAGKEYVVDTEALTLTVRGSRVTGTLTHLAQENIGLEAPHCTTGTVAFTAKRT